MLLVLTWAPDSAEAQAIRPVPNSTGARAETLAVGADARAVAFTVTAAPYVLRLDDLTRGVTRLIVAPSSPRPPIEAIAFADSGQRVLFSTARGDVVTSPGSVCQPPGEDCNGMTDVFRYDRYNGRVYRVSLTCFGEESTGACREMAPDAYGSRVAMVCTGSDLVPGDTNGNADVFLRDDGARWTFPVSLADWGAQANAPSGAEALDGVAAPGLAVDATGGLIAFVSAASNLVRDDENGALDVFVRDLLGSRTERVSLTSGGQELDGDSGRTGIDISGDGRLVVFETDAPDVADPAASPGPHVYLRDRATGTTVRVSRERPDCLAAGASTHPAISTDGLVVSFLSSHPCLDVDEGDAPSGGPHLYAWERVSDRLHLVDHAPGGGPADAPVLAYRLADNGASALLQSAATDLVEDLPPGGDGAARLYLAPTVPDRDGDGLYDDWETFGLDLDGDGAVELDLAELGADPDHHDLFVEYDYLYSPAHDHRLSATVIDWLVAAFAAAPLDNPDGTTGIRLHLDAEGADAIPLTAATTRLSLSDLTDLRRFYYGNAEERLRPDWAQRRVARALVYRYGVVGHQLDIGGASGLAEFPGDEFLVTLGYFEGGIGTLGQQAGTFMHELGHTLGLNHGGSDALNCKPNYLSVMSYSFQFPDLVPERPLDYSRDALLDLLETDLDEPLGVGGPPGMTVVYGPGHVGPDGFTPEFADAGGPIDWNVNLDATETGVAADINSISYFCPSHPGEYLTAFDDWDNLVYNARGAADWVPGRHLTAVRDELDAGDYEALRAASPWGDNAPPVALIAPLGEVRSGERVRLDGSASFDPEGAALTAAWARGAGPDVTPADPAALETTLVAPEVAGQQSIVLELAVFDGVFWSAPAFAELVVHGEPRSGALAPAGPAAGEHVGEVGRAGVVWAADAGDSADGAPSLPEVGGNDTASPGASPPRGHGEGCGCGAAGGGHRTSDPALLLGLPIALELRRRRATRRSRATARSASG